MGWISLVTVLLKIVQHYLKNKTPDEKRSYVNNLRDMSESLVDGDVDRVNLLFDELRESAREGDPLGLGAEATTRRQLPGDPGVDR